MKSDKQVEASGALLAVANDNLINRLYVEPIMAARKDWPVTEKPSIGSNVQELLARHCD